MYNDNVSHSLKLGSVQLRLAYCWWPNCLALRLQGLIERYSNHLILQVIQSQGEVIKRLRAEKLLIEGIPSDILKCWFADFSVRGRDFLKLTIIKVWLETNSCQFQRAATVIVVLFCVIVSSVMQQSSWATQPSMIWERSTQESGVIRPRKMGSFLKERTLSRVWSNVFNWTTGRLQLVRMFFFQRWSLLFQVNHQTKRCKVQKNQQVKVKINGRVTRTIKNV